MVEYSGYWGGTTIGDAAVSAPYSDDFFSDAWSLLFTYDRTSQGVILTANTAYNGMLAVTAPGGGLVRVAKGAALVDGKIYKNTANVDNAVATPGAGTNYYRLVLQKDFVGQNVRITLLGPSLVGTPSVTQTDGTTWEISLATIVVSAAGVITIIDTRNYVFSSDHYVVDNATATVSEAIALIHQTSGTAAAGFGVRLGFELENAAGDVEPAGSVGAAWSVATDGAERARLEFRANYIATAQLLGVLVAYSTAGVDGNARGDGSIDLQPYRAAAAEVASGALATIVGGAVNTCAGNISGIFSSNDSTIEAAAVECTIIGGYFHNIIAGAEKSVIVGGEAGYLTADALGCAILAGKDNTIDGLSYNAIIAGEANTITNGTLGVISGGYNNDITNGVACGIFGGSNHTITGSTASVIIGGSTNAVSGDYSLAAGRRAHDGGFDGVFVWSDSLDADFTAERDNQVMIRASGGVNIRQADAGSSANVIWLNQQDVDTSFIGLEGDASAADLTRNLVAPADVGVATSAGFFLVYVKDDGNQIADGFYYVQLFTLAAP